MGCDGVCLGSGGGRGQWGVMGVIKGCVGW